MIQLIKKIFFVQSGKRKQAEQLYNEGILFANEKKYDDAIECFQKGIKTDPLYSYSYNGIGNIYFIKRNYEKAIEYFENALKIDPVNTKFNTNLGLAYRSQDRFTESVVYFSKASNKDTHDKKAAFFLYETEDILKQKKRFDLEYLDLKDYVKFFLCPNGHDFINKDCSFCNLMYYTILDKFESVEESWIQLFVLFYNSEMREELKTVIRKSGYMFTFRKILSRIIKLNEIYDIDYFRYPMSQWNVNNIKMVWEQIVNGCRGITKFHCIENINPIDIRNMFEDILFTFYEYEETNIKNVFALNFRHKLTGKIAYVFCYTENIELLDKTPFYFKIMPFGIEKNGLIVTMSIKNKIVKIHTNNSGFGVKAEYAYMKQMFPNSNVKSQMLSTKIIDNFEVTVDILSTDKNEVVVFDISDFYGTGTVTIFSDLQK
ncbi:MAG: tetratricopeptide repeat protein [Paludibacter sp.]|nr:tetratricopeptide repeat protein [Paludibacter sp.]